MPKTKMPKVGPALVKAMQDLYKKHYDDFCSTREFPPKYPVPMIVWSSIMTELKEAQLPDYKPSLLDSMTFQAKMRASLRKSIRPTSMRKIAKRAKSAKTAISETTEEPSKHKPQDEPTIETTEPTIEDTGNATRTPEPAIETMEVTIESIKERTQETCQDVSETTSDTISKCSSQPEPVISEVSPQSTPRHREATEKKEHSTDSFGRIAVAVERIVEIVEVASIHRDRFMAEEALRQSIVHAATMKKMKMDELAFEKAHGLLSANEFRVKYEQLKANFP
ncbi:hypothetical protein LEN26_008640 [Aphanomyces euteiches]|nr:hypothetical protein AeMF1_011324 [Aphanomyces euteiches]KAH9130317.1 hypothetical protein LEN26_008640 [Aphanomyces euteiches]KAH9190205.1 hypothetical protein AeNC1_007820 [Aphanomyces euteiches]